MTLQQLKYFQETIHRSLNLTAAAAALHTSQPGLSKAIRELEDELGFALFVRNGKRLESLTDEGSQVALIVRRMLVEADNLKRCAQELKGVNGGSLTIAATHTQARYVLPQAILLVKKQFPQIQISIRQGTPSQIVKMITSGQVNLGIATEALAQQPELTALELFQWRHVVIVPKIHALAKKKTVDWQMLGEHDIVTYDLEFAGRSRIDAAFADAGVVPNVVLQATDADVIKTYVRLGLGVGIIADLATDSTDDTQSLVRLEIKPAMAPNVSYMAFQKGRVLRKAETVLINALKKIDPSQA
jgi:DNA-binding transcriptional LysR family regulator